jgi:hypothetical protein
MGYDISGPDGLYLRLPAGAFNQMAIQGFYWFGEIGAAEMDGMGCSGIGRSKEITLKRLEHTMVILERVAPGERSPPIDLKPGTSIFEMANQDPFQFWKAPLVHFMMGCIEWCKKNNKERIEIDFA